MLLAIFTLSCGGGDSPDTTDEERITAFDRDSRPVSPERAGLDAQLSEQGIEVRLTRDRSYVYFEADYPPGVEGADVEFTGLTEDAITVSRSLSERVAVIAARPGFRGEINAGARAEITWQSTRPKRTSAVDVTFEQIGVPQDVPNQLSFTARLSGDGTNDGLINFSDITAVIDNFGRSADASERAERLDYSGDGTVEFSDVLAVIDNFGIRISEYQLLPETQGAKPQLSLDPDQALRENQGQTYREVLFPSPALSVQVAAVGGLLGGQQQTLSVSRVWQLHDPLQVDWDETSVVWWNDGLVGVSELSSGKTGILTSVDQQTSANPAVWDSTNDRLIFFGGTGSQDSALWSSSLDGDGASLVTGDLPGSGPIGLFEVSPTGEQLILLRGQLDLEQRQFPDSYMLELSSGDHIQLAEQQVSQGRDLIPGDWVPGTNTFSAGLLNIDFESFTFDADLYRFTPSDGSGQQWTGLGGSRTFATGRFDTDGSGNRYFVGFELVPQIFAGTVEGRAYSIPLDGNWQVAGSPVELTDESFAGQLPGAPALRESDGRIAIPYRTQEDNPSFSLLLEEHANASGSPRIHDSWSGDNAASARTRWFNSDTLISLTNPEEDPPAFILTTVPPMSGGTFSETTQTGSDWTAYAITDSSRVVTTVNSEGGELRVYPDPTTGQPFANPLQQLTTGAPGAPQGLLLPDGFQAATN